MIGPGGSGKSSLRCSLMNKELPLLASSTLLADTYSVKYQWARSGDCEGEQGWVELTDDDEMDEMASLLEMVVSFQETGSISTMTSVVGLLTSAKDAIAIKLFGTHSAGSQSPSTQVREDASGKKSVQEILKEVSSRLRRQRQRQRPQSEVLIRIWDCGGQLVFLNILPAFLTPRTLFMLTFDASVPLNNKAPVVTHQEGNVVRTEDHHLSTAELLLQWMASIHSHLKSKKPDGIPEQFPRIMLVGTHRDKLVDASGTSTSAEQDIRLELESRYDDKYYADLLLPSPLYFVDNTRAGKGKDEDPVAKKIRQSVHKYILEDLSVRTPVTWVLFRKVMKRMFKDKPIVELREVRAIAKACLIPSEAVLNVLNFYHQLGVFLHFANIPGLHNVVITDPQWLIRNFAKVFATIEVEDQGMERMWKLLRSEGILVQRLYEKVLAGIEVEPQALIDLLSHFLLVAPIPPRRFHEYRDDKWYFVPSMLPEPSDDSDLPDGRAPEYKAETLHLAFASRYVPPGFFVRLIASLTHAKKRTVLLPCTDCRRVRFIYGSLDEFLVKESAESIELLLIRQHSTRKHDPSFNSTCQDVLQLLRDSIEDVRKWLPFEPNFAFKCAKCNVGFHVIAPTTAVLPCSRSECSQNFLSTVEHQYWLQCQPVHGIPNPEGGRFSLTPFQHNYRDKLTCS